MQRKAKNMTICTTCSDMASSEYGIEEPHEAHADYCMLTGIELGYCPCNQCDFRTSPCDGCSDETEAQELSLIAGLDMCRSCSDAYYDLDEQETK